MVARPDTPLLFNGLQPEDGRRGQKGLLQSAMAEADLAGLQVLRTVSQTVQRVSFLSTDAGGVITSFNRGAEFLTGYSAGEVIGRWTPLLFHLPEEIAARSGGMDAGYEVFTRDATTDGIDELECTYLRKDGVEIAVYLAIQALRGGEEGGFLSIVRPVPGQSIHGDESAVRAFAGRPPFEIVREGVLELAQDWTVLYRNGRAFEILTDLQLSKSLWELYPTLVGTFVEENLRSAMEHRRQTSYENYYAPADIWFRVHALPSPAGIKVIFQDITLEKKLQDRLAREQILREKRIEAISHMAGGLAHEISNPLAIINMMAGDLESFASGKELVDAGEVKTTCAIILETSNRAMAILRGLKGFTREASKDPMVAAPFPKIIDECLQLQRSRFERNGIELRVETSTALPAVTCREVQIGQIINNLLNNAFDAVVALVTCSRAVGGWVCIRTVLEGAFVRLDVLDSGPGVPEEAKPHLMEPFFTTKEIGGGTGIGLSLSRAIAEDHGGTLTLVEQDGPTCFRLLLPVYPLLMQQVIGADTL